MSQGINLDEIRFAWILLLAGLAIATFVYVLTEADHIFPNIPC